MNRLERWRLDRGLSYDDMHKRMGISTPGMICKWCMHPDHTSYQMPDENERMVIQMMRQLRVVVGKGEVLGARLEEAIVAINRDVVDAKRQFELG